jgi:hypothetical protein
MAAIEAACLVRPKNIAELRQGALVVADSHLMVESICTAKKSRYDPPTD